MIFYFLCNIRAVNGYNLLTQSLFSLQNLVKLSSFSGRSSFSSQMLPRAKETFPRVAVPRVSVEKHSGAVHSGSDISKEHPRSCDICRRSETMLNPILVCSSCKVSFLSFDLIFFNFFLNLLSA